MSTNDVIKSIKNCPQWWMSCWNHVKFKYHDKQLLSNFKAEIIILPLVTEAEMKNGVAYTKNNMDLVKTYWCLCLEFCKWKTFTMEAASFLYISYILFHFPSYNSCIWTTRLGSMFMFKFLFDFLFKLSWKLLGGYRPNIW